jgi:hypothetical protein
MSRHALAALAALALVAVLPPAAGATTARVRALGGQSDLLEDDLGVVRWYGALADYPDLAVLETGDLDHDAGGSITDKLAGSGGGLHAAFDQAGRWGVAAMYFGDDLPEPDPGGWFRLLYARRFGPVALGATFRGTSHSEAVSAPPDQTLQGGSRFLHDLGLGARWDVSDRLYADLAADIREGEIDYYDNANGITYEDDGSFDSFSLRGRAFHGLTRDIAAVLRLEWQRDLRPVTDDIMAGLVDLDATVFRAGLGFNILPDPDNLVIASVDYDRREENRDARHPFYAQWEDGWRDWWRLDVRVGIESRVRPWLTLRGAASYRRTVDEHLYTYDWTGYEERLYDYEVSVRTPVTLGCALHVGPVDADLVFNDRALFDMDSGCARRDTGEDATYTSLTIGYEW